MSVQLSHLGWGYGRPDPGSLTPVPDHDLVHALRDKKAGRGTALGLDVWRGMPDLLRAAKVYLDTLDEALLYEIDAGGQLGKVVVRVNYNDKGQIDGVRARITSNFIHTGGRVEPFNLAEARYVRLGG